MSTGFNPMLMNTVFYRENIQENIGLLTSSSNLIAKQVHKVSHMSPVIDTFRVENCIYPSIKTK